MDHAKRVHRARNSATRKKGKLKQQRKHREGEIRTVSVVQEDPNAIIIVPKAKEQKEAERREKIRQELIVQADSKWSSKKKKRLEKYIEKKLKKEERVFLYERLAKTQAEIPSSFQLQSSGSLGTGRAMTHQERLDQLEHREVRRAMDGRAGKRKRGDSYAVTHADGESDDVDEFLDSRGGGRPYPLRDPESEQGNADMHTEADGVPSLPPVSILPAAVGSALRQNGGGTVVAHGAPEKTGKKISFKSWRDDRKKHLVPPEPEVSDTSFDSSDSANDTGGEDESGDVGQSSQSESEESKESERKSSQEADDSTSGPGPEPPRKRLGFKEWATMQLHIAKGYDAPAALTSPAHASPPQRKKRRLDSTQPQEMRGPLGEDFTLPDTTFAQRWGHADGVATMAKTTAVLVKRLPDIEEVRVMLPVVTEEQPIMEAILLNPVVIICGETGSGKTTQVPQFLYEAGFGSPDGDNPGMIGVTQPRRVAAMAMAARVARELSLTSSRVSYQIRYDATISPSTSIKFMTDGVLLRELATDFLLTKYSVIIIDEAHERSINTDILIGVMSRVLKLRENMWKEGKDGVKPLRLIIMSATLRVSDFVENRALFSAPPPVITVAARQHLVTIHFSRRTSSDYVSEAVKKTIKIHTRLPPGGILIFLTGQNEITGVCRRLEGRFGTKAIEDRKKRQMMTRQKVDVDQDAEVENVVNPAQVDVEAEDVNLGQGRQDDLAFDMDGNGNGEGDPDALDSEDERALDEELGLESDEPMHVVPLYSLLPSEKQMRVFEPPPVGSRLVVVATNVAETSLTIPGIRYVVDCGRAKERRYDIKSGIQSFTINWISKASAAQRAGRAGRTGPGHCYRLYSSALFEHYFDQFARPEIQRMPIEGVVLQMKSMHIDSVINFPFPTPPDRATLQQAEKVLTNLGALSNRGIVAGSGSTCGQITPLGKTMALFPLSPRFSRMLVNGQQHSCLPYVIAIVAALSVGDPFLHDEGLEARDDAVGSDQEDEFAHLESETVKVKEQRRIRRKAFFESQRVHASLGQFTSDVFKILSVVGAYEYAGGGHKFCEEHFVRPKAMEEIHKLRAQISNIVQVNFPGVDAGFASNLLPPNSLQLKVLRQLLTAGFIDQVAVRKDRISNTSGNQYATTNDVPYKALGIQEDVFIHPSSVLASASPPEYVVFSEVVRTTSVWLKGVTVVNPVWLSALGKPSLCTFSKPTKNMAGVMMTIPRFGPDSWELPPIKAETLQK